MIINNNNCKILEFANYQICEYQHSALVYESVSSIVKIALAE